MGQLLSQGVSSATQPHITISLNKNEYFPGELIQGLITIEILNVQVLHELWVYLKGKEVVSQMDKQQMQ